MLAAVYYAPGDTRVEERPVPEMGPDEALLRVRAAAICGTDLRIMRGGHFKIPAGQTRVLGHEYAGEIVAVGERVTSLKAGMRVAGAPNIGCGTCIQCIQGNAIYCPTYGAFGITLDGAHAQYMLIPAAAIDQGNIVEIPANLPYEEAVLAEPLGCCYNGITACHVTLGEVVVIIGAGPIGIFHVQLARLSGARMVIMCELSPERLAGVMKYGVDLGVNPGEEDPVEFVRRHTQGAGADVVIVAAPSPQAQEQAIEMLGYQGRVNFFGGLPPAVKGITLPSNTVHYKQLVITGTTGANNYHYRQSLGLIASGRIDVKSIIGGRFPLAQMDEAVELAKSGKAGKVILEP